MPSAFEIPQGNFGQRVARGVSGPPQPVANPVGAAVQQLGNTAAGVMNDAAQAQTRLDAQERVRQEAAAEAAERGREALALQQTQDALTDLRDSVAEGVRQGTIAKDKAESEWQAQAGKLTGEAAKQFRPESRELVSARLAGLAGRFGNDVRRAREQRDRQDVTVSLDGILESAQRDYGSDPEGSRAKVSGALSALGPMSNYPPEVLARKGQAWLEGAQFTAGFEAISRGRRDRKALGDAVDFLGTLTEIDPQRRVQLQDRASSYLFALDQQDEMRAARAARAAEAHLRKAEASFTAFQAIADKGTVIDPAFIDQTLAATRGTPYAAGVSALAAQARETGGFAAQPISVQRATLDALDAQISEQGRNPSNDRHRAKLQAVFDASQGAAKEDGLRAYAARGGPPVIPIDPSGGIPGIVAQLGERVQQADLARQWAGAPVSPLTSDEAAGLGQMLRNVPPEQFGVAVATLSSAVPAHQMGALARMIDSRDRPLALAMAAGSQNTTQGRTVAELIRRGAQVASDKGVKEEKGAEFGVRSSIAKYVGEMLPGQAREDVIDAARFISLAKQAEGQTISAAGAVHLALGGPVVEFNGRRIPVPPEMDAPKLQERLLRYPEQAISAQAPDGYVYLPGGRPMGVPEFLAALPQAQLEPAGFGRYTVRSGGSLVLNRSRQPITLSLP